MAQTHGFHFCCGAVEVQAANGFNGHELMDYAFGVATFNRGQQHRYEQLKNHYTIIAQSPPVMNPNSGNWIFAVVFTTKGKRVLNAARS